MTKRRQILEIHAPTLGIKSDAPTDILDPRSSPNLLDAKLYYGVVQKEYGTSLYATGTQSVLGAPINFLFEAQFPNASVLQALTHTSVNKYTSGSDSFVSDGQIFSGTVDDYWSGLMYDDRFLYGNGVNPLQHKASIAATGTNLASAVSPNTYNAWAIGALREHLVLYHTIEDGSEYAKRVRWTKKSPLTYSAGTTDFASGTAGAVDIPDMEGVIRTAVPLGAGMAIYADDSIHVQFWVGGDEVYRFQKTVSGLGTISRRGAASYKGINYFISRDNFHAYFGGDDVRDIGDAIKVQAFGELNKDQMLHAWVEVNPIEDEILFHIPTTGTLTDTVWVYKIADDAWSKLSRGHSSSGRFTRVTGLTIGELIGDIGAQNFRYSDAFINAESQIRLWGDQSGRVVKEDRAVYSVSVSGTQTPQTYIYETPDLTGAKAVDPVNKIPVDFNTVDKRWTEFYCQLVGNGTANIYFSVDKGATYRQLPGSPVTLLAGGTSHALDVDDRSEQIRFRIINTATNEPIGVRYAKIEFLPSSENLGGTQ